MILVAYLLIALVFSVLNYRVNISPIRTRWGSSVERDPARTELVRRIATMFALVPNLALGLFGLTSGLVLCKSRVGRGNFTPGLSQIRT
jgi:hypothetical protein